MAFVDYYAVLNVSQDATEEEINNAFFQIFDEGAPAGQFKLASEAHDVLSESRDRAAYDKTFGFLLVIQTEPAPYLSGLCFQLAKPEQAHLKLMGIIEEFKSWVVKKTNLEWEEAQHENYDYDLHADNDEPYLVLRFASEKDLASFVQKLKDDRKIKRD